MAQVKESFVQMQSLGFVQIRASKNIPFISTCLKQSTYHSILVFYQICYFRCCIHPNICNPKPSLYTKAGSQCRNSKMSILLKDINSTYCTYLCIKHFLLILDCQKPDNCVNPCSRTLCLVGTKCVNDYCSGCTAKCVRKCSFKKYITLFSFF